MATLKEIDMRLKSITNIQKITKSMKMVSAAKFARAERELKPARPYGAGALAFYEKVEMKQDEQKPHHLMIALTSDRGLCGAIHSNVARSIRAQMAILPEGVEAKIICIGDKSRSMLRRQFAKNILMHFTDIGKKPPSFGDAATVANQVLDCGYEFEHAQLFHNIFKTVVSYRTNITPIYNPESIKETEKLNIYDSLDEDVIRCYTEYSLVSIIWYAMKEAATAEQSSRMTAMDAATKNAGEMIEKLQLTYNRTRQAVITNELIEIISGAAALE